MTESEITTMSQLQGNQCIQSLRRWHNRTLGTICLSTVVRVQCRTISLNFYNT